MRRVSYYIILTADGMYADPDGGLDHYDPAEDEHRYANDLIREPTDEFTGRRMYEVMDYWDELDIDAPGTPDVEREYAERWRATREARHQSRRPAPPRERRAGQRRSGRGDPCAARPATARTSTSAAARSCFATFAEADLIDIYRWLVIPTAIGSGKHLFGSLHRPLDLRLIGTRTFSSGAVLMEYEPAGR